MSAFGTQRSVGRALLALVLVMASFPGCSGSGHSPSEDAPSEDSHGQGSSAFLTLTPEAAARAGIEVEESMLSEFPDFIETTASVSANQSRVAHIRPLSTGTARRVLVQKGDQVNQGQKLVEYDSIQMGELLGELAALQARLQGSVAIEERALRLRRSGEELYRAEAISARELDSRETEHRMAKEAVNRLRAEMARTVERLRLLGAPGEQIEQARGEGGLRPDALASLTVLKAPFSATVIDTEVAAGEVVSPDRSLLTLVDLSTVWVMADVYEEDLGRVAVGQRVEVKTRSYPDRSFPARITSIGDVLDPQTRTVKVRCLAENPGRWLKLGMFAAVRIEKSAAREVITVPTSAVQTIDDESVVFVQIDGTRFERREVRLGPEWQGRRVIEAGLQPGERVVGQGAFALKSELLREALSGHQH